MHRTVGNLWTYTKDPIGWGVIPTNGFVKNNGEAVMGRGLAQQLARKDRHFPKLLGGAINLMGNRVHEFTEQRIFTFPTKHNWWEKSDLNLIRKSMIELREQVGKRDLNVYIPQVGCGNGQLEWHQVEPILEKYWDVRFILIER